MGQGERSASGVVAIMSLPFFSPRGSLSIERTEVVRKFYQMRLDVSFPVLHQISESENLHPGIFVLQFQLYPQPTILLS